VVEWSHGKLKKDTKKWIIHTLMAEK